MHVTIRILPPGQYIEDAAEKKGVAAAICWAKQDKFARAYTVGDTITVMEGFEHDNKLMAHEYGHALGKEHPHTGPAETLWGNIMGAALAGFPIMSAYGFLRWRDPEGLVEEWLKAEKTTV